MDDPGAHRYWIAVALDAESFDLAPRGAYHAGCKKSKRIKADIGLDAIAV